MAVPARAVSAPAQSSSALAFADSSLRVLGSQALHQLLLGLGQNCLAAAAPRRQWSSTGEPVPLQACLSALVFDAEAVMANGS